MTGKKDKQEVNRNLLDVGQTARRLNLSKSTVYRLIHTGELKAAAFGPVRGFQVWGSSVEAYERRKTEEAYCLEL